MFQNPPSVEKTAYQPLTPPAVVSSLNADISGTKTITATDVKYKICTLGAKFHIGFGQAVTIRMNGRTYQAKTHSSSKGRIDGLKQLYEDNNLSTGDEINIVYDATKNIIQLTR